MEGSEPRKGGSELRKSDSELWNGGFEPRKEVVECEGQLAEVKFCQC